MPLDNKLPSRVILEGHDRAGTRSMLKAIGFTDADLIKPIVGVAEPVRGPAETRGDWW